MDYGMASKAKTRWCGALLALAAAPAGFGQSAGATEAGPRTLFSPASIGATASGQAVREIDDPTTGSRWLLVRDDECPGGPGRLVPVGAPYKKSGQTHPGAQTEPSKILPVVRAGDRLIVEEHSAVVDARLEAVALGPAVTGSPLNVRLQIGGKIVRAVALGPGRATLAVQTGAQL